MVRRTTRVRPEDGPGPEQNATPLEPDEGETEEFQTTVVTAMTDADGAYTLHFVTPGTYVIIVGVDDGLGTDPESVEVEVGPDEDVTDVDFEVVSGS